MNADRKGRCCDPRVMAVALGRWAIGMIFLFFGLGKLKDVSGFAHNFIVDKFKDTWLPPGLLSAYGHVLPFVETLLGALLILGVCRNATLFATGVLLLSLTFGQILLKQAPYVFNNTGYLFMVAALLFLGDYDRWVLYPRVRQAGEGRAGES